jgi:hypothetical protein
MMGMMIEEHKEHLLDIMDSMPDDACGDWRDSLAYAIETMHKYQKMQEVLEKVWNVPSCMLDKEECLNKIMETYRTVR